MPEALFSPHWYRVRSLRPRLPAQVRIHRHSIRGQIWWVLHDPLSRRDFRFSTAAYHALARMDGQLTVKEIWDQVNSELGDDAPTQDGLIRLLGQLHAADLLQCEVAPDTRELFRRQEEHRQRQWRQWLRNPLSPRIPLFNPEGLLDRLRPWVLPCLGRTGLLVWLVCVAAAAVLAVGHWKELTDNPLDRLLTAQNLLLFGSLLPVMKILHEFAHAFAVKKWGGEVAEMGVMLILFLPVPYVDASASNALANKYQRMAVAAAGIMSDLLLAALALFLWLLAEPGLIRAAAYDLILAGGLSSLLFNGNPLLRYDGYYVFADWIEIPNLASRAGRYWAYLGRRYLLGERSAESPVTAEGEAKWLCAYGLAAWLYRNLVLLALAWFALREYPGVGLALAGLALVSQWLLPAWRLLSYPWASRELALRRGRAGGAALAAAGVLTWLLFFLPLPSWTSAEGVVWPPEDALVRAGASGTVQRLRVDSHVRVGKDEPLIDIEDPFLRAELGILEARRAELDARRAAEWQRNQVEANILQDEFRSVEAEIHRLEERLAGLAVLSPLAGTVVFPEARDLPGRYVKQGELLCYILGESTGVTVRAMIPQEHIGLVRDHSESIAVRLVGEAWRGYPAHLLRQVPQATDKLPSGVLGTSGGGKLAVDPGDDSGTRLLVPEFQLELAVEGAAEPLRLGLGRRVHIRFEHTEEPLATQIGRAIRQLFLSQIHV